VGVQAVQIGYRPPRPGSLVWALVAVDLAILAATSPRLAATWPPREPPPGPAAASSGASGAAAVEACGQPGLEALSAVFPPGSSSGVN
jgi:hypothetical protein